MTKQRTSFPEFNNNQQKQTPLKLRQPHQTPRKPKISWKPIQSHPTWIKKNFFKNPEESCSETEHTAAEKAVLEIRITEKLLNQYKHQIVMITGEINKTFRKTFSIFGNDRQLITLP